MQDQTQTEPQGDLVICTVAMPADTNANGDIFGGWLVSHMDLGGGAAGWRRAHCRVVTVAIESMNFKKPINVGDVVYCYAKLLKVGHTSMQFQIEVFTMAIQDEKQKKVADGIFTYVAIDEEGKPQPVDR